MNQKNGKNSLGIDKCFEDLDNPIELFDNWFKVAKSEEINDPNALALATSDENNQPNVRMVLLKGLNDNGFVFYTNLTSKKGEEINNNKKASLLKIIFSSFYHRKFSCMLPNIWSVNVIKVNSICNLKIII